jgi:ribosomal protein RSM22 (predicted rRNA methylase)
VYPLFDLPPVFEGYLEGRLNKLGHTLQEPEKLALAIRKLSNMFLKGENLGDYWTNKDHRAAYISYFSILNFVRARSVFFEARRREFLKNVESVVDWGCGAGAATWAMLAEWQHPKTPHVSGIDQSAAALEEFKEWGKNFDVKAHTQKSPLSEIAKTKSDTVVVSYVLNEIESWPEIPPQVKRLIIIEPSTHQAGRRLLRWRDAQLRKGWHAWAPCTHQNDCPLLVHSGKDWCHHRVHWNKPSWFYDLEKFLPMRNDTLTLTYLLMSREPPAQNLKGIARVVGDEQEEKGKTRQMICRGPGREFLSWLHRDQISLKLHRGDLIEIGQNVQPRANELRVFLAETVRLVGIEDE